MTAVKPLIGMPARHDLGDMYKVKVWAASESYSRGIVAAGGIPFIFPIDLPEADLRRIFEMADGIMLTGGGDILPEFYGQAAKVKLSDVQRDRDEIEIALTRWALAEKKPLLGICRGSQVIAVAGGGQMYQDLHQDQPEATAHLYEYTEDVSNIAAKIIHTVQLKPDSKLAAHLGTTEIEVNSLHHQAVASVPAPFEVVGRSNDGVVEAIEVPDHPFLCGVQWHPEALLDSQPHARDIFSAFVESCR